MVLKKKTNYEKERVKLTNSQLNKLTHAAKNKTGITLRITTKNFQHEELSHELLVTPSQKTKIKKVNNMLTDIKFRKAHLFKIIQSVGFLGALLGKSAGSTMKVAVRLANIFLSPFPSMASASATDGAI